MDDLIPFLIFIVIALVNLVKFVAEKNAKGKTPVAPGEQPPAKEPNSIEDFFENLAEKLEPKPVEPAGWPEAVAFEEDNYPYAEEPAAEIIPMPVPVPIVHEPTPDLAGIAAATMRTSIASAPNAFAGIKSLRIATSPTAKSGAGISFSLRDKSELRKALIANIIFSPPRAFDTSFENTIAK